MTQHYNHEIATIKYYFESAAENDSTYTWTTDMTIEQANELKEGFANSLKKWNNVYFYSHGSSGNIVKNKIINVVEGTETDHNLSIYPEDGNASFARFESTEGKYCRYVAPFDDLVEQQYSYSRFGTERHRCISEVVGLEYFFSELHTMENEMCTKCGYHIHLYTDHYQQHTDTDHLQYCRCGNFIVETHSYTHHYQKYNSAGHYAYCACGDHIETAHVLMRPVGGSLGGLSVCKYCGEQVSFGVLDSIPADYPHTENGSYILPNGIIVLAPEDEEAYLAGTLEFRTGEIM